MKNDDASTRYLVKPGQKIDVTECTTSDKDLWEVGNKEASYSLMLEKLERLKELQNMLYAEGKHKVLVVIQAMDTGGKDGCAKKVFASMDPQGIFVKGFKAPSEEELGYDYLWRVHKEVPKRGMIGVFNRSHYEDIIAVRVKDIFSKEVWKKRYQHIVNFEQMLADEGTKIVKIFLNISKGEQKERLQDRLDDSAKHWKFNPNDLKDRALWDDFMEVYSDVLSRTSTKDAPWHVIPADRKWYRNLVVAQIMIDALEELDMSYPEVSWNPNEMIIK